MKLKASFLLPTLLLSLLLGTGCSKEQFAGSPTSDGFTADNVQVSQQKVCASSTLVKPPVDILYLVDNSLSSAYIDVKSQLRNTIQAVSQEFDYHVMVAPLLPPSSDSENLTFYPVITNNASNMNASVNVVSLENLTFFSTATGVNSEDGLNRSVNMILANRANGIFRQNAHTIVVLMSNGDDTTASSCLNGQCFPITSQIDDRYNALMNLKATLNAQQFRFFSVVAQTSACKPGYKQGAVYQQISSRIYTASGATDQTGRSTPDSYDLCTSAYATLYTGVNTSIHQQVVGHTYDRWLISTSTSPNIDTNDVQVYKINSAGASTQLANSTSDGFTCCQSGTYPTRVLPTVGESATGTFIQLFGSAKVAYPDCLVVKTRTPTEYYGWVVAPSQPQVNTIIVRVRGTQIAHNSTNGWSYEGDSGYTGSGYRENQNIKENADGSPNTSAPLNKTGYFIKLNGTAKYVSGDSVEIFYTPTAI